MPEIIELGLGKPKPVFVPEQQVFGSPNRGEFLSEAKHYAELESFLKSNGFSVERIVTIPKHYSESVVNRRVVRKFHDEQLGGLHLALPNTRFLAVLNNELARLANTNSHHIVLTFKGQPDAFHRALFHVSLFSASR